MILHKLYLCEVDRIIFSFPCQITFNNVKEDIIIFTQIGKEGVVYYKTKSSSNRKLNNLRIERGNNAMTIFQILYSKFTIKETEEIEHQFTAIIKREQGLV
jgi:hypothetical protein